MKGPILKSKRITLRPIKLSDVESFCRWMNDKEVVKYLLFQSGIEVKEEIKWIRIQQRNKNKIIWSIENEENILIGNTCLELDAKNKVANLGIVIGEKKQWGKGYAVEVLELLKNYVFKKLKYNRFELEYRMDNKRAEKVYLKSGFKKEGVKKKNYFNLITKKYGDTGLMSILKEEYKK